MATLKFGSNSLLTLTSRITTPSIHIQKDGNHWYVPLFSGNKGSVILSGDYNYTLGGLKVGSYRAAESRAFRNRAPVIRLKNLPDKHNDGAVSFDIEYGDADHDNCTIEYGYLYKGFGSYTELRRTGLIDVSTPNNVSDSNYGQTIHVTVPRTSVIWPDDWLEDYPDQSRFRDGRTFDTDYCVVYASIKDANGMYGDIVYGRFEYGTNLVID